MIAAATMALLVAGERWPKPEYTVHVRTFEAGIYTVNVEGEVFEFTAQPRGEEITISPIGQRPTMLPVMDRPGGNRQIGTAAIGRDRRGRISLYPGEAVDLLKPRVELSCGNTVDPAIPQRVAQPVDMALEFARWTGTPRSWWASPGDTADQSSKFTVDSAGNLQLAFDDEAIRKRIVARLSRESAEERLQRLQGLHDRIEQEGQTGVDWRSLLLGK